MFCNPNIRFQLNQTNDSPKRFPTIVKNTKPRVINVKKATQTSAPVKFIKVKVNPNPIKQYEEQE